MKTLLHKIVLSFALLMGALLPNLHAQGVERAGPRISGPTHPTSAATRPASDAPMISGPTIRHETTPARGGREVSLAEANAVFQRMAAMTDITFHYVWDGCFARSTLMVRRMQAMGYDPQQVFTRASGTLLQVATPNGTVFWRYHMAPVLRVRDGGRSIWMVIDPSLFSHPVPVEEWVARQKAPSDRLGPMVDVVPLNRSHFEGDRQPVPGFGLGEMRARQYMEYLRTLDPRNPPPHDWMDRAASLAGPRPVTLMERIRTSSTALVN